LVHLPWTFEKTAAFRELLKFWIKGFNHERSGKNVSELKRLIFAGYGSGKGIQEYG
jgi:hypothetical protein